MAPHGAQLVEKRRELCWIVRELPSSLITSRRRFRDSPKTVGPNEFVEAAADRLPPRLTVALQKAANAGNR